jgi:hypothetical protein
MEGGSRTEEGAGEVLTTSKGQVPKWKICYNELLSLTINVVVQWVHISFNISLD